jgi:D-alanyl-D-alanine carboxypeptidase
MKSRLTRNDLRANNILALGLLLLVSTHSLVGQTDHAGDFHALGNLKDASGAPLAFDSVLAVKFQRAIDSIRILRGFKGVSAAVFLPDQGIWQGVSGVSYGTQPITAEMKFDIASNTKSFVSTTILQLAEEGLLSLDDTLSKYLPPLPNITASVTIRQLLNMTSGLSDTHSDALEAAVFADPNKVWTPEESIAAFVGPPAGKPGGPWMYCNTNYILLGMVISQITASTISSQVRQRILTPVSLDSTYFGGEETFSGPSAHPWYNGTDISSIPRTALYTVGLAAGAMVSTAADIARGVKALFEGSLIAQASLEQMRTCVPIPPGITFGGFDGLEMRGYGLGVFQAAIADPRGMKIPIWGHGGHAYGYRSFMAYHPSLKAGCAAFINQSTGDPEELIAVLIEILEQTMVAYAHNISVAPPTPRKQLDTVRIRATVENPQNHSLGVTAFTKDFASGNIQDSILLYNDGVHGDGLANDSTWGGMFVPTTVGVYGVSVRTVDGGAGTTREVPIATAFATAGPAKYVGYRYDESSTETVPAPGVELLLDVGIRNMGNSGLITNVTARISALDSLVDYASPALLRWGTLFPGDTVYYPSNFADLILGTDRAAGSTASFVLNISSNGYQFWRDTIRIVLRGVEGVEGKEKSLPISYALEQNYPNPFNPNTIIKFDLPKSSVVRLSVFDILGREVSVLVNERKDAGVHEFKFDGSNCASGVYFYRIQAGDFVQTRKLLMLR